MDSRDGPLGADPDYPRYYGEGSTGSRSLSSSPVGQTTKDHQQQQLPPLQQPATAALARVASPLRKRRSSLQPIRTGLTSQLAAGKH